MPAPMPRGTPIRDAMPRMIAEPTMAFPIPPPFSPTGTGPCVRNARFSDPIPLTTSDAKIATSGEMTMMAATVAATVAPVFLTRRAILSRRILLLGIGPRRHSASRHPHQGASDHIHDQGNEEKAQADLDDRTEIEVGSGFAEFISNDASHAAGRCEQRLRDLRCIADHHGNGHRLA